MPVPIRPAEEGKKRAAGGDKHWMFALGGPLRALRRRDTLAAGAAVVVLCLLGWTVHTYLGETHPSTNPPRLIAPQPRALSGVIVILDPGHGGEDPGATVHWGRQTVHEAALTYRMALEVARDLRADGAQVRFTVRSRMLADGWEVTEPTPTVPLDSVLVADDRPLRMRAGRSPRQLWERAALARRVWETARADPHAPRDVFFLSLHYDDCRQRSVRGGLVCVDRRAGPPPAFGVALAQGMTLHGWGRTDALDGQPSLASDGLGVLNPRFNPVPQKALLELATLSNFDDYMRASDPEWRAQVAAMITGAVAEVHGKP